MAAPLRAEHERWLGLGLLLAVLALAYLLLVHPWWTLPMRALGARIAALQERELRLRTQLEQAPAIERRLGEVLAAQRGRAGFLPEATPELATAGLVQRLETVVAQASPGNRSCQITNRSPVAESRPDRYPRVTVQVRLRCGAPELGAVLHALESGTPRVFVDNLNVLAQRYFFLPGQGHASGSGGLDVSFDLYGYLATRTAAPAGRSHAR
jgi:general secretion pathway protein M